MVVGGPEFKQLANRNIDNQRPGPISKKMQIRIIHIKYAVQT